MTHYWNNKVGQIIKEEFDARLDGMVITQITLMGWDAAAKITDEEIENSKENGMFPKEATQGLFRACKRIATECDMYEDFFPYIRKYLGINNCPVHDITLEKTSFADWEWEGMLDELGIDPDELDENSYGSVDIIAIVD